jgi:hypothetical protein
MVNRHVSVGSKDFGDNKDILKFLSPVALQEVHELL